MNQIVSENPIPENNRKIEEEVRKRVAEIEAITSSEVNIEEEQKRIAIKNAIVEELNKTIAIVHTSSTYILMEKSESEFVLDSKASLLNLYQNQIIPELSGKNSKKHPTKAQIWLESPYRRTYDKIVFNPKIVGHYDKNYNIWKGFAIGPKIGDCILFWEHVKDIICNGHEVHYNYTRKWLAHLIQYPWKIGTALVLRGKQGTGKGTFVETIGKLFGPHYAPLASLDKILGRFNAHLQNSILIFADEAIWGGNKKEVGLLKSLITEPRLFIEGKGKDGYWIDNYKHLIVSSNEDWAVHLDPDDRRFFVLNVSDKRKEDLPYFDKIYKQLENGGYEALMHDLLHEDLIGFEPRHMPENFSGFDMKLKSALSIDRFIYASLKEGSWNPEEEYYQSFEEISISKFYENYKSWCYSDQQDVMPKAQMGKRLKAIFPGMKTKKTSRTEDPKRPVKYIFQSLERCKASFEKIL